MSTAAGYPGNACGYDLIDVHVFCLTGERLSFRVSPVTSGKEVCKLVLKQLKQLPSKKGRTFALYHDSSPLLFRQTLQEQGIGQAAELSCTFVPTKLCAAWCFIKGLPMPEEEFALEGLTRIEGAKEGDYLQNLPQTLKMLTFAAFFNQSMQGVVLPERLQSLTFGYAFNQPMQGVRLPNSLRSLTFGECFNQSMEGVMFPESLQSLTFGKSMLWLNRSPKSGFEGSLATSHPACSG